MSFELQAVDVFLHSVLKTLRKEKGRLSLGERYFESDIK